MRMRRCILAISLGESIEPDIHCTVGSAIWVALPKQGANMDIVHEFYAEQFREAGWYTSS